MEQTSSKAFGLSEFWHGLLTIFRHTKEHKRQLWVLFALTIFSSTLNAFMPTIWGKTIDSITYQWNVSLFGLVIYGPAFMIAIWFIASAVSSFISWQETLQSNMVEEQVRTTYLADAYNHLFRLPMEYHKTSKSGETAEKINRAAQAINNVFTDTIMNNFPGVLTTLIMFLIVAHINLLFGAIMGIGIILSTIISFHQLNAATLIQREMQSYYKAARGLTSDAVTNIKVVKDFATEAYEYDRINSYYKDKAIPAWYRLFKMNRNNGFAQNTVGLIMRFVIFILSIYFASKGYMTIGQIVAINGMVSLGPLTALVNSRWRLQNSIIAIEEAEGILEEPMEIYQPLGSEKRHFNNGGVVFKNVSFSYEPEKMILKDISFQVKPGEVVALVGESGVGKSTLIDLLLGYYFPNGGAIEIDGIATNEISLVELRKNVAVVTQEITLFNDTIRNNIAYGSPDATEEMVHTAAIKAHCKDFIDKFPLTWEQIVGERGVKLSVGQKQRVAIARAILRNPKILILDEPTSALDAGSEKIITESLEILMKGKTTFIVAHRLSTVRKADKIVVLKDGRIIEQGNHADLMKIKEGEYRRLYDLQIGLSS